MLAAATRRCSTPRRATPASPTRCSAPRAAIHVRLCVPANVTPERKRLLRAYGADLVLTDPMEGSDGAIREARRLLDARPGRATSIPTSTATTRTGARTSTTTGAEILEQTGGRVTHFVAGLGTSGTFIGTGRRLRAAAIPASRLVAVQPDSPLHGARRAQAHGVGDRAGIYDPASPTTRSSRHRRRARADAAPRARGRTVRRALERRGARRLSSRSRAPSIAASSSPSFPTAATATYRDRSGSDAPARAARFRVETRAGDPRACAQATYPRRMLRRPARSEDGRCHREALALSTTSQIASGAGVPRRTRRLPRAPKRAPRSAAASSSASITRIRIIRRCRPRSTSQHAWPNLSYVIVSVRERPPRRAAALVAARATTGPRSTKNA